MRIVRAFSFCLFVLVAVFCSWGVYTKKLEISFSPQTLSEFAVASNVSIQSPEGGISLGYSMKSIFAGTEMFVSWVERIDENLMIATANPNNIYAYSRGRVESIGSFPNHSIITKLKVIDGLFYVLTGEKASVYLLSIFGNEQLASLDDSYVWDIFKFNGRYYVVTGNKARLYEVARGSYRKIFESDSEKHFLVTLVERDRVFIGSSGTGTIYMFDGNRVVPFVSLKDSEVTDIKRYGGFLIVSTYNIAQRQQQASQEDKSQQPPPTPINILRNTQGNVYRVELATRKVELLFSELGVTSLDVIGDKVFATTIDGKVVEYSFVDGTTRYSFYGKNFLKIFKFGEEVYVSSANPSGLDIFNPNQGEVFGYVETREMDVGRVSSWGRVRYDGVVPKDTSISVFIKGGNTPKEDRTWSDWVEVREFVSLDRYQYIKLKVVLTSRDPKFSPLLRSVSLFYTPCNSKPVVSSFVVTNHSDLLSFEWRCSDPDNDRMNFRIYAKNYDEGVWQVVSKEPLTETKFSINRYLLGNGIFDFMLVADDSPTNPKGIELSVTNFIRNYVVDVTPPSVDRQSVKVRKGENVVLELRVVDNFLLKDVQYSTDGIEWNYVLPLDGVVDSGSEMFRIELSKDARVVLLKIVDTFGNITTERISI